jgi:DegV family protein with EDD domain
MTIAIVTDSTADLPPDLARAHHIHVVANLIVIDDVSVEDGVGISREEFYQRLPTMKSIPTTGTASSGIYQKLYQEIFAQGASHILSIHPSGLLSGILNAAHTAAQTFEGRVKVVDSEFIAMGLGFQALAAAEAASRGLTIEAILDYLDQFRQRIHVIAMLDTLEYVRRSGRVSWARARIGNLLQVKPFIGLQKGQVLSLGESRTRRKGVERLTQMVRNLGNLERLAVVHTNAEADAHQFLKELNPPVATPPLIVNVTTVIGAHIGPNALGAIAVTQ